MCYTSFKKARSYHLQIEPLFNTYQSCYKQHHSTETTLAKITNDISVAMDKRQVTVLSLLDFTAAFDTINHKILLDRLSNCFYITLTALSWFKSYLMDRHQMVHIGSANSFDAICYHGVPQGFVLSPILFTLYTSPIYSIVENRGLHSHYYANDT